MARRPYTTKARLFTDSDEEVTLRWYPATEPIEVLPFPTAINSRDWKSRPWEYEGLGEVFGAERKYNGAKALPYARGLTPCQDASVFVNGVPYDPDREPTLYNADHFPLCCLNQFTMRAGIVWGGNAVVTFSPFSPGSDCNSAFEGTVGEWYQATVAPGSSHWFVYVAPPASFYSVDRLLPDPASPDLRLTWMWSDPYRCVALQAFFNLKPVPPGCSMADFLIPSRPFHYLRFANEGTSPVTYRFRYRRGGCPAPA